MTKILIRILFLVAVAGGGIFYAQQNKDSEAITGLEEKKTQFQGTVKGITDNISDQTQELTARGQEVGEHVSNILGAYINPVEESSSTTNNSSQSSSNSKENDSVSNSSDNSNNSSNSSNDVNKPIYEETFEYGRYLYCQQVMKDYEARH